MSIGLCCFSYRPSILCRMVDIGLIAIALAGVLAGAILALVPGLHVYNVVGVAIIFATRGFLSFSGEGMAMAMIGLIVGWSTLNVIPAVFLFAPDDASAFVVTPATRYLLRGAGVQAVLLIGAGSLGALLCLVLLSPILDEILRPLRAIFQPHMGWILAAICGFLILGEWPRGNDLAPTPFKRLLSAWVWLGAGLLTFGLSGILGFVLLYRSPIPAEAAFTNLLPAFVGLFAVPSLIQTFFFGRQPPTQRIGPFDLPPSLLVRGTLTGVAGGLFAGFLPVISGGIGGLLAGHATAQHDERVFMISQGASKVAYYAGSLLLLFVPGLTLTRGGMAWMLSTLYVPYGWHMYSLAVAAIALGGVFAFGLLIMLTRLVARLSVRINTKILAVAALIVTCGVTVGFTGLAGLGVLVVASLIGLIPVLVGGRRMDCLGVLLAPMTLNFIGVAPAVARWIGLM
jgi:putative membrane protein